MLCVEKHVRMNKEEVKSIAVKEKDLDDFASIVSAMPQQ
jgi:hypothetical protein